MPESDPQETAVLIFAHFLGIDIETEHHLLYIAQDALSAKGLPKGWELGIGEGENEGIPYFFNTETEESVWNHPKEAIFLRKVKEEKEKDKRRKAQTDKPKESQPKNGEKALSTAVTRDDIKPSVKATEKVEAAMEVVDFEDVVSPEKAAAPTAVPLADATTKAKEKDGVVTANSNNRGFGMQPTDFFADGEADDPPPKAPVITATTTTVTQNTKTAATTVSSALGPKKTARPGTADTWASGNSGNSKARETSPPSSPGLSRVTGPPVSSRTTRDDVANQDRDRNTRGDREWANTANSSTQNGAQDREREMREREAKEEARSKREREAREREREAKERERDAREREREREARERERERVPVARTREIEAELTIERRRADDESRRGEQLAIEITQLRDKNRRLEEQMEEERADRREAEERVYRLQTDSEERTRESTDKWEERVREAARTARQDTEQDWKERFKGLERRSEEELQEARDEIRTSKARAEEALKEIDALRRRVSLSRDDGKMEAKLELEKLRSEVEDYEAKCRAQTLELRRLREEHVEVGSRLAAALQAAQVAHAEAEAAKSQAASIVAEGKSSHTALVQATNRIQSLDSECAKLKADNLLHRREIDSQQAELRKLQAAAGMSTEQLQAQDHDLRRAKATAQNEVLRLTSKLSEQDAVMEMMRTQLEKAQSCQADAVREVDKQLDRSVFDNNRLQERVKELESKYTRSTARSQDLEKDLIIAQDSVFRAERTLREEQQRNQTLAQRLEQQRATLESELAQARESLHQARLAENDLQAKHRDEVEAIKREVAERIPRISQAAVERVEGHFQAKLESEAGALRARHETQMQGLKRELIEMQAVQAEREARQRASTADERAELDRLKSLTARQHRQIESLETELDDALMALRRAGGRALMMNTSVTSVQPSDEAKAAPAASNISLFDQRDESITAVSQLQGQLAWMKQQLNMALESTADKKLQRAMGEHQSSHFSPRTTRTRPAPHVSFSPESLFQSPNPTTGSKSRSTITTQRPDKTATAPRSVFSHIRFQPDTVQEVGEQAAAEAEEDEAEDQDLPYGSTGNQSAIERSYANYEGGITKATVPNTTKSVGMPAADDDEFDSIQDGGFHEGYWKARYAKSRR